MRAYFSFIPLLVVVFLGCGQAAVDPPAGLMLAADPPLASRVRLMTTLGSPYDGFRFTDRAVITTRLVWSGNSSTPEVRGSDGTIVMGDAQRTDIHFQVGRYTVLAAPGNALCFLQGPFVSVAAIDGSACTTWIHQQVLDLVGTSTTNFAGAGLIVRTESGVFRMRIVESGWDITKNANFVLLDYVADPRLTASLGPVPSTTQCAAAGQFCQVRDNCCNSRHSCQAGVCEY